MEKMRRQYPDIAPAGPTYARAVRAGNMLFISGCTARGTEAQGGPPIDQLKAILDRITRIVSAEGRLPIPEAGSFAAADRTLFLVMPLYSRGSLRSFIAEQRRATPDPPT